MVVLRPRKTEELGGALERRQSGDSGDVDQHERVERSKT